MPLQPEQARVHDASSLRLLSQIHCRTEVPLAKAEQQRRIAQAHVLRRRSDAGKERLQRRIRITLGSLCCGEAFDISGMAG
jgi:hypothetical protein